MKFVYSNEETGETREIALLYGDNLYQYKYGSQKKHMDISNAAFAYLKHGKGLSSTSVNWTNLNTLKFYGSHKLTVTFARCDWGNKKIMYASKHGNQINIRRAPFAIGKILMKNVESEDACNATQGDENWKEWKEAYRLKDSDESWSLYSFTEGKNGKFVCLKMWPYKYENEKSCSFIDAINIENGVKSSMDGLRKPEDWKCTDSPGLDTSGAVEDSSTP